MTSPPPRSLALALALAFAPLGFADAQEPPALFGPGREADFLPPPATCAVDACRARWPSFREIDCTYQPENGLRRYCVATPPSASVVDHFAGTVARRAPDLALRVDLAPSDRLNAPPGSTLPPRNATALRVKAVLVSPVTWFVAATGVLGFLVAAFRRGVARRIMSSGSAPRALSVVARPDFGRQKLSTGAFGFNRRIVGDLFPLEDEARAAREPAS